MAISVGGIGSGIDIDGLVTQLVAAEGQPVLLRLAQNEAGFQADLSAIGTLKSALSNFQETVAALQDPDVFLARSVTSSDNDLFTATADTSAVAGSYDIEVFQLAQAARLRSNDFTSDDEVIGTGTIDITLGSDSFQLTIDTDNQTLAGIRDAINAAEDNPGITASIVNVDSGTRLILSSDEVGAANTITVSAVDDDGGDGFDLARLDSVNLSSLKNAQDAIIYVDQQQVTRSSNSFSDVITGVTFSLADSAPGTTETLTVAQDKSATTGKINGFVAAYNELAETVKQLGAFDAESGVAGGLQGDATLRSIQSQLRNIITTSVAGIDFGTLAEIGITTDESGGLTVDSEKLDSVIDNDFTSISSLFASDNGLATSLDTFLEQYVSSSGVLNSRTEILQSRIDSLSDDRDRLDQRLLSIEARYRTQFNSLDLLVAQLQSVGNFLTQQLANLPKPNSINRN